MKNRIIYHLVKSENQKCKYAEQLKAKLNEAADEYIEKSVDRENINYDYIHMILIQDREKCMQYSQILFISDEFFGMFCDLNVFLERVIKEGAEIFSLKKTENNLPDFNFLCLDGNILKNDVPDEKTVCDKCTY